MLGLGVNLEVNVATRVVLDVRQRVVDRVDLLADLILLLVQRCGEQRDVVDGLAPEVLLEVVLEPGQVVFGQSLV